MYAIRTAGRKWFALKTSSGTREKKPRCLERTIRISEREKHPKANWEQRPVSHEDDCARVAVVTASAWQPFEGLVPQACWPAQGSYPANCDCRSRAQATDRTVALSRHRSRA